MSRHETLILTTALPLFLTMSAGERAAAASFSLSAELRLVTSDCARCSTCRLRQKRNPPTAPKSRTTATSAAPPMSMYLRPWLFLDSATLWLIIRSTVALPTVEGGGAEAV